MRNEEEMVEAKEKEDEGAAWRRGSGSVAPIGFDDGRLGEE